MARQYRRSNNGKFSGSAGGKATTIKQDRAGHTAVKKKQKDNLSGNKLGGKNKRTRSEVKTKVKGKKTQTKAAILAAKRSRKRFG